MPDKFFDRFTDGGRRALAYAQMEAKSLQHDYVGTEHLLLGLTDDSETFARAVLNEMHVDKTRIHQAVEEIVGRGAVVSDRPLRFTPRIKRVIELAGKAARQRGERYIDTRHLLLGLVDEGESLAIHLLQDLGIDLKHMRNLIDQRASD